MKVNEYKRYVVDECKRYVVDECKSIFDCHGNDTKVDLSI